MWSMWKISVTINIDRQTDRQTDENTGIVETWKHDDIMPIGMLIKHPGWQGFTTRVSDCIQLLFGSMM